MSARWAQPAPGEPFCLIDVVAGGSVQTACLGRYVASTCTYVDIPPENERCRGCVNATELEVTVVVDVEDVGGGT